jgi:hypothetical protein
MAGCGYVCPKCEGRGFLEDGTVCDWCSSETGKGNDEMADKVSGDGFIFRIKENSNVGESCCLLKQHDPHTLL